jgi:YaiO family outer membrane protein
MYYNRVSKDVIRTKFIMRTGWYAGAIAVAVCLAHGGATAAEGSSLRGLRAPASALDAMLPGDTGSGGSAGLKRPRTEAPPGFGLPLLLSGGLIDEHRVHAGNFDYRYTLHQPAGQNVPALADAGIHTLHEVLPRYTLSTQVTQLLPGGWGVGFGVRQNQYSLASTNLLSLSAERNWGSFRGAYTLHSNRTDGAAFGASHRFELSYSYGDRNVVGLSYTTGRDLEYLGVPMNPYTMDVRDWSLSGRHWLSTNWALTYDVLQQEQGPLYRRSGLRFGVSRSF